MTSDILNSIRSSWSKQFLSEAQYKKGTSLLETATSMAQSAGYAISGVLLSFGLVTTIYTLIVIFLVSTVPLVAIRDSTQDKTADNGSLGRSMAEGIRYIRNSGALKAIITITLFVNLAFGSVGIFFAYLVDFVFRLSAVFYGLMFLSLTIGLILGSALGSAIRGKLGFYNTIFIFVIGIMMVSMGFADIIYLDFFVVFIIGLLVGQVNVISQTGVLKIVSQDMIARVYGAFSTFALGITFLSGGIGGILIDLLTLRWSFVLIGGIISLVAVLSVVSREYYNLSV
jgi:Na+/melibiose symporter-like transporter